MKFIISTRVTITFAACLAMVMSSIESNITATTMPYITKDLGGINFYRWIATTYLLANTIVMPLFGKLADNYGRKRIYLIALFLFFMGSILCGMSVNIIMLLTSRVIQGVGAGGLLVLSTTLLSDLYTAYERAKIQAFLSALWNAAGAAGPYIGGIIIHHLNWRYAFYINIPICIIAYILISKNLKNDHKITQHKFDNLGFILFAASSLCLLISFENGISILGISIAIIIFYLFLEYEKKIANQIIPFNVVKKNYVLFPCFASCVSRASATSLINYLPLFLVTSTNTDPINIGLSLTPIIIGSFLGNSLIGLLSKYYSLKTIGVYMQASYFMMSVASSFFIINDMLSSIFHISMLLLGITLGGATMTGMLVIQFKSVQNERAVATGLLSFSRSMGGALGVGLLGALISKFDNVLLLDVSKQNYFLYSLKNIFVLIPVIAFFGIFIAFKYPNVKINNQN